MDQQERPPSASGNGEAAGLEEQHANSKGDDAQLQVLDAVGGEGAVGSGEEAAKGEEPPAIRFAVVTLADRSAYEGQATADGVPDGFGVLTTVFGSVYAGQLRSGMRHGLGVETGTNGTTYAGEFVDDKPSGYGVHTSGLGDKYIGQWREGSRHGVGMCIDVDARVTLARFDADEPDHRVAHEESDDDYLLHVKLAFYAEVSAIRSQETARDNQLAAVLQADLTIDGCVLETTEDVASFEAAAQAELETFVRAQDAETAELSAAASALKLEEAQLAQRQKQLAQEITVRGQELERVARFCGVAAARQAEAQEARRVLAMLQRQHAALAQLADGISANEIVS